jgi:hypothetical protein
MQASYAVKMTTADGTDVEVPLSAGSPEIGDDAIDIVKLQFTPWPMDKGKGMAIGFDVLFKSGAKPVAIAVDDVSDEPILSVYTDKEPKLTPKHHWIAVSPAHNAADEYAKWLLTLDNSIKVYRFTIKLADGSTHVLRYPLFVPAQMKGFMRTELGVTA